MKNIIMSKGIVITKGVETKEYVIVIKGDVDGNGEVNFDDILQVNKHRLKKVLLKGAFEIAANVNNDNAIDFDDILQINKFRLKKITTL